MWVKMLKTAAGPEGVWAAESVVEIEDGTAQEWLALGVAEEVTSDELRVTRGAGEVAAVAAPERAVKSRPAARKGTTKAEAKAEEGTTKAEEK